MESTSAPIRKRDNSSTPVKDSVSGTATVIDSSTTVNATLSDSNADGPITNLNQEVSYQSASAMTEPVN